jgi:hypothetical protein
VTEANSKTLFDKIAGKSAREVEKIIAGMAPKADVADQIRTVPTRNVSVGLVEAGVGETGTFPFAVEESVPVKTPSALPEKKADKMEYLSETRVHIKFTANKHCIRKFKR